MRHTSIRGIMGGGNGQKAATARARNQAKADAEKARISQLRKCWDFATVGDFF